MNDLISEFFYEGIRRIIPGLVATALFFHTLIANVIRAHPTIHGFIPIFGILIFAWLLGLVIEEAASFFAEMCWLHGGRYLGEERFLIIRGWLIQRGKPSSLQKPTEIMKLVEGGKPLAEEIITRQTWRMEILSWSEREMSRSLSAIFFVSMVLHFFKSEFFSNIQWHSYYDLIGAFVFCFTWLWADLQHKKVPPNKEDAIVTE